MYEQVKLDMLTVMKANLHTVDISSTTYLPCFVNVVKERPLRANAFHTRTCFSSCTISPLIKQHKGVVQCALSGPEPKQGLSKGRR